mgnify:CR=1 FL=1
MTTLTMAGFESQQFEDKRFYRLLWLGFLLWLVFAVLIPALTVPERSRQLQEQLPPQLARVMLEERKAPPPPEPEPVPEQVVEPVKPEPAPEPVEATPEQVKPDPQQARQQAEQAGLMAMRDDLAALRQSFQLNNSAPQVKSRGEQQATQVERKLLRNEAAKSFASAEAAAVAGDIARSELADTGSTRLAETELKGLSANAPAQQQNRSAADGSGTGPPALRHPRHRPAPPGTRRAVPPSRSRAGPETICDRGKRCCDSRRAGGNAPTPAIRAR